MSPANSLNEIQSYTFSSAEQLSQSEHEESCDRSENVSEAEQWLSVLAGGGLTLFGLRKGSWLGLGSAVAGAALLYRGFSGHCSVYEQLGISTHDGHSSENGGMGRTSRRGIQAGQGRKVKWTLHIQRSAHDLYTFWRNLENLPGIMRHLESVTAIDERRSRWQAHAPLGTTLEWEAELITDRPDELIAWQSLPGSQVATAGSVHFRETGSGQSTEMVVSLRYDPPGGKPIAELAYVLGYGLEHQIQEDLNRFRHTMEAGTVPISAPYPSVTKG